MNDEHSLGRSLKQKWDEEDAERATQEARAQQIFLEAEASRTFAPIEDYFTRLGRVLSATGASVELDTAWARLSDRRLRGVARITSSDPPRQLRLEFTIQAARTIYAKGRDFTKVIHNLDSLMITDSRRLLQTK
jgi:hypothetical protein